MAILSATGSGNDSALKTLGGGRNLPVGNLVGPRVVYASTGSFAGTTATVSLNQTLVGSSTDYVVLVSSASHSYCSTVATTSLIMTGVSGQNFTFAVIRKSNPSVAFGN